MKNTSTFKKYLILGVFSFFLISFSVYAGFKLPWGEINEEQANGFLVMNGVGNTKTITVHSDCKKVTAIGKNVFIPTRTLTEWVQFKTHATNVGAIVSDCITYTGTWIAGSCSTSCGDGVVNAPTCSGGPCDPALKPVSGGYCNNGACTTKVDGICGSTANSCNSGSPSDYSVGSCNGNQTWKCLGSGGGSDTNCSLANTNAIYYYYYNPDVLSAGVDAYAHWITYGYKEGRRSCYPIPVSGVCGGSPWTCNTGTPANGNGATACNTTSGWDCLGTNGGSNAACTYTNAACAVRCITTTITVLCSLIDRNENYLQQYTQAFTVAQINIGAGETTTITTVSGISHPWYLWRWDPLGVTCDATGNLYPSAGGYCVVKHAD